MLGYNVLTRTSVKNLKNGSYNDLVSTIKEEYSNKNLLFLSFLNDIVFLMKGMHISTKEVFQVS